MHNEPYRPLRDGMPVPSTGIDDDPRVSVCVAKSWVPALTTALKTLTRPEVWIGSIPSIKETCQDAHTLIGRFDEPCVGVGCPNWYLDNVNLNCSFLNPLSYLNEVNEPDCSSYSRFYMGFSGIYDALHPDLYIMEVRGYDAETSDFVGGHFHSVHAHITDNTLANVWTITTEPCIGSTLIENAGGSDMYKNNFDAKALCIMSLAPFMVSIVIHGPWTCGVA